MQVTTKDDDQAGFILTETDGKTEVNETGATDTFTVVLSKQPVSNVSFKIVSVTTSEATVDKGTLSFTTANWNVAQTVTVSGVQDGRIDGNQTVSITVSVDGPNSQAQFAALAAQTVSVNVVDSGLLNPWQNAANRFDVSGDGNVVPLDALQVINELNEAKHRNASGLLPAQRPAGASFYDVNGNGFATTNDALQVINLLNARPNPEGEGVDNWLTAASAWLARQDPFSDDDDLEMLLADWAGEGWCATARN